MKRSTYDERDYAFGQMMLTLRTTIGLTQAGLAERLGVSRCAVAEWEAGSSYPKAERLKELVALGVQQQIFPAGREAEEIRVLWKAAHQKVLLDELWLAILREPVTFEELLAVLAMPLSRAQVMDAVEALRRRSLVERGQRRGSFTLQSVVLEYAAARLIAEASREIEQGNLSRLIEQ